MKTRFEASEIDMTSGSPVRSIIRFSLPLMAGMLLQRCYNFIDAVIVGQFVGVNALAAMGVAGWPTWMVLNIILEYAAGCGIIAAQCFGKRDLEKFRKSYVTALVTGGALALLVTGAMQVAIRPMLVMLNTPEAVFHLTETYLRIYCAGAVFTVLYNLLSALLRAVGNSNTPFVAMAAATVSNIVLDLVFVALLGWGIAGAAIATVLSQILAALICLGAIRNNEHFIVQRRHMRLDFGIVKESCRLCVPMMLQGLIISLGGLIVQRVMNGYSETFIAGIAASDQIYSFVEVIAIALRNCVSVFVSQNLGAGAIDRIRRAMRGFSLFGFGLSLALAALVFFFGGNVLHLFISNADPALAAASLTVAHGQLRVTSFAVITLFQMYLMRTALQSLGNTVLPMLAGCIQALVRIAAALYLPLLFGREALYYNDLCAHAITICIVGIGYFIRMRALEQGIEPGKIAGVQEKTP